MVVTFCVWTGVDVVVFFNSTEFFLFLIRVEKRTRTASLKVNRVKKRTQRGRAEA